MFQQFGARLVAEETVQQPLLVEHHTDVDAGITTATTPTFANADAAPSQTEERDGSSFYEFFRH